ncbi:hypothetical protein SAMN06295967_10237 [Belliella buryatensis]|uniref:Uncharacterized protein n=1 Tax=Belliella buryatensis TaxID=1500549 RepID=A0A239B1V5_9BACT|nr:hypothetical protein [Belliella buryatensis]SNS01214.1 hypothetical protein SAMN06295967_10237 [Belliella buryatensis]
MHASFIQDTFQLIKKDFSLETTESIEAEEALLQFLKPIVHQMLNRDFERLLQVCYRIDLGENRLKQILHETDPELMVDELSVAIIKRQKQKIEIRRKYSQ